MFHNCPMLPVFKGMKFESRGGIPRCPQTITGLAEVVNMSKEQIED